VAECKGIKGQISPKEQFQVQSSEFRVQSQAGPVARVQRFAFNGFFSEL
jgi:hypothetical protein